MHLEVPFYPSFPTPGNPDGIHCEEMSLKMILGYFLPNRTFTVEELEQITAKQPEKASWEMPFAIWLVDHGFQVKHLTTFDFLAFEREGLKYVERTYGPEVARWQKENSDINLAQAQVSEFLQKVTIVRHKPTLEDIQKGLGEGYLARVMVDAGTLNNLGKYVGHSVVVTGYNDQKVWFHDPGLPAFENREAARSLFQKAMDQFGGEMDLMRRVRTLTS